MTTGSRWRGGPPPTGLRDGSVGEADNAGSGAVVLALTRASSGHGSVAVSLADGHVPG